MKLCPAAKSQQQVSGCCIAHTNRGSAELPPTMDCCPTSCGLDGLRIIASSWKNLASAIAAMERKSGLTSRAACPAPSCADDSSESRLGMHRGLAAMQGSDRNRSGEQFGEVGGNKPFPLMVEITLASKVLVPNSEEDLIEEPAKSTPTCLGDNGKSVATPLNVTMPRASSRDRSNEEIDGAPIAAVATPICASADFAQHAGVEPPH